MLWLVTESNSQRYVKSEHYYIVRPTFERALRKVPRDEVEAGVEN